MQQTLVERYQKATDTDFTFVLSSLHTFASVVLIHFLMMALKTTAANACKELRTNMKPVSIAF